jgi:hypothetical protein
MRKFKKLKRIVNMAQKSGKGSINKKYALVTVTPPKNNRILGDTNPNKKIVTSRQRSLSEAKSTSVSYFIRRLYDTLLYLTQLKQEFFNKNYIFEYLGVIAYKRSKIRQVFVSMKFLNLATLNRLSNTFSK